MSTPAMRPFYVWLLLGMCPLLWAQEAMRDPTRPATFGWTAPSPGKLMPSPALPATSLPKTLPAKVEVLVSGGEKKVAVVDGILVKPGAMLKDWRVNAVSERGVVLQRQAKTQSISLTPHVLKSIKTPGSQPEEFEPTEPNLRSLP